MDVPALSPKEFILQELTPPAAISKTETVIMLVVNFLIISDIIMIHNPRKLT